MKIPSNVVRAMRANGCKYPHELLLAGTSNALKLPECSVKTVRWCVDNAPIVIYKHTEDQYQFALNSLTNQSRSEFEIFMIDRLTADLVIGKRLITDHWCPLYIAAVCASVTTVNTAQPSDFKTYNVNEVELC
jgi:hypothetical protein